MERKRDFFAAHIYQLLDHFGEWDSSGKMPEVFKTGIAHLNSQPTPTSENNARLNIPKYENLNWKRLLNGLDEARDNARLSDIVGNEEELFYPRGSDTIEDVVERAFTEFSGTQLYRTIEEKAISTITTIEYNHTFTGGNKRGGFLVAIWLLEEGGFTASEDIAEALACYAAACAPGGKEQKEIDALSAKAIGYLVSLLEKQN